MNGNGRAVQNHAVYAGMVEAMDQAVGKVLATLDRLRLTEQTLVIFTSDNGGLATSEGHPTTNLPLRAGKDGFMKAAFEWHRLSAGLVCLHPVPSWKLQ